MDWILASASPRRRLLLESMGYQVEVEPSGLDEHELPGESPAETALRLAVAKASANFASGKVIIAADTLVALDGEQLGKPQDVQQAREFLYRLSGKTHQVLTGWCVRLDEHKRSGVVKTDVTFRMLSAREISAYLATEEYVDKAGAYGIQGKGGALVDGVHGSYPNVVGLPVAEVLAAISDVTIRHRKRSEKSGKSET